MQFHSKQIWWNFKHTTLSTEAEDLTTKEPSAYFFTLGEAVSGTSICKAGSPGGRGGTEGSGAPLLRGRGSVLTSVLRGRGE